MTSVDDLEAKLGAWASGSTTTEAAVELIIETNHWLSRAEFVERAVIVEGETAVIDWDVAERLADEVQCSRGERFVLRLACSLGAPGKTAPMAEISTLDGRNLERVVDALRTARFGW